MKTPLVAVVALGALACGGESRRARQVQDCSTTHLKALDIALCLTTEFGWADAEAQTAGRARERQLDSIRTAQEDSAWRTQGAQRRAEFSRCAGDRRPAECLQIQFGWPQSRAVASADSVWLRDSVKHRSQIRDCLRRERTANISACLQLNYQWEAGRALAANDSVRRAQLR